MRRTAIATLFFIGLIAAWQALALGGRWSPVLLPSLQSVGEYLCVSLQDGTLLGATAVTLRRLFLGYALGLRDRAAARPALEQI